MVLFLFCEVPVVEPDVDFVAADPACLRSLGVGVSGYIGHLDI